MNELRNKSLSVKLTVKEDEALTEICDALQISKSAFIRNLIRERLI